MVKRIQFISGEAPFVPGDWHTRSGLSMEEAASFIEQVFADDLSRQGALQAARDALETPEVFHTFPAV
jgi:hypothetical protein